MSPKETATRINQAGLAAEYVRMRIDYERSDILDREPLRKIGAALGVRYVFQPRLAFFNQTIYQRWEFPGLNVWVLQTRVSILRQSLQLWDTETGELLWASLGEGDLPGRRAISCPSVPSGGGTHYLGQHCLRSNIRKDGLPIHSDGRST